MSEFDALFDLIPIGDIAKNIGIDEIIAHVLPIIAPHRHGLDC
jgi:hypothetical protein